MRQFLIGMAMAVGLLVATAGPGKADTVFDLAWSGAAFGNDASATGTITLNLADIKNPGTTEQDVTPFVTDFSITVTGASSGDGTFNFSDFNGAPPSQVGGFYIITGGTLDFSSQLVGQSTPEGPWASKHDGSTGDFNIFNNGTDLNAPEGTFFFQLTTADGNGDNMYLTSFAPAAVPEPSSLILLSTALLGIAFVARKRHAQV
jgi:hypothetical protein